MRLLGLVLLKSNGWQKHATPHDANSHHLNANSNGNIIEQ